MDITGIVNWMQRETFPDGTIRKYALTQEALPDGIPFMDGFVELFPGATLPLTVDVQAAELSSPRRLSRRSSSPPSPLIVGMLRTEVTPSMA